MEIPTTPEFLELCKQILSESRSTQDWAAIESDDMFQSHSFVGGFDADEMAFTFSYYDESKNEYWFQLTLDEVAEVCEGRKTRLNLRSSVR
jgi:hypothetical protein